MLPLRVVVDTNVLISALRSRRGASFRLLALVGRSPAFQVSLSVPLVLEYEAVGKRQSRSLGLTYQDVDDVIDYVCSVADLREIYFLWRPFLKDPMDDMVLEVAVEAECDAIITFNKRDFAGISQFGLRVLSPQEFLEEIGEIP